MREYRGALSGRIQARLQRSERPRIIELGNLLSHARWLIWRTLGGTYSGPPPDNIEEDDEWTQLWVDKGYDHAGSRTRSYSRGQKIPSDQREHIDAAIGQQKIPSDLREQIDATLEDLTQADPTRQPEGGTSEVPRDP